MPAPSVRRFGNIVYLKGVARNKAKFNEHTAFYTIPEGFRPKHDWAFIQQGSGSARFCITIHPDGTVHFDRYSNTTTMNQEVPIDSWLNTYCSWIVD